MPKSFAGGVHPPHHKERTSALPIERISAPKTVVVPLQQHIGTVNRPLVAVGDRVLRGQKIGDHDTGLVCPTHSSVAGRVMSIEMLPHPNGHEVLSVVIENDFSDEIHPACQAPDVNAMGPQELRTWIREAGIVGMGGGGFPAHVKITPPAGRPIEIVLLNGAECEPYLTSDHRIMLEWADDVVFGLRCLMRASEAKRGAIGVETNKMDAISALRGAIGGATDIEVVPLEVKYPQGAEQQLIKACLNRRVPKGKRPVHIGVVVNNVHTAQAVAQSLRTGMPSIERVITVDGGCVGQPGNLLVPVGTLFADILAARNPTCEPSKVLSGGPLMGMAMYTTRVPVCKCTSGILAFTAAESPPYEILPCVRCAGCVDVCPMFLYPTYIAQHGERGHLEAAEKYGATECHECGACSFICPSRIPLVQRIRLTKAAIYARNDRGSGR